MEPQNGVPPELAAARRRAVERERRIVGAGWTAAVVRGAAFIMTLVATPIAVRHLGEESFGIWAAVTSITGLFAFADLGLGSGLVNAIADSVGRDDSRAAARYVSSTFMLLTSVALVLGIAFTLVHPSIPWADVLGAGDAPVADDVGPSIALFVTLFLVAIPLSVPQRVHLGLQEGSLAALWAGLGNILGLAGVIVAVWLDANVVGMIGAMGAGPVIAGLLSGYRLFFLVRPELRPRLALASQAAARKVARLGALFFGLGIAGAIAYEIDIYVIARMLGAERVAEYVLPMRLFTIAPILLSFFLAPLWPAYGEATARGDIDWIRRTFKRSLWLATSVAVPIAVFMTVLGPWIVEVWAGGEVEPALSVFVAFGLWTVTTALSGPVAMFLNGVGVVSFQLVWSLVMAFGNLVLSIVLVENLGVAGAIYGSLIAQVALMLFPSAIFMRRFLRALPQA